MESCLTVSHLYKSYDRLPVLEDWNLEIGKGERIALLGPSGCGKTTFLKIAAGLEAPTGGSITLHSRKTGFVFQEPRLIPWQTVRRNLFFVNEQGDTRSILTELGLAGFEDQFPAHLSGGMRQRVNLARALMVDPDLLVMDEAFHSLDLGIKIKIMEDLTRLWEQRRFTLILVTHDPREAIFLADRILLLSGRPAQIREEYPVNAGEARDYFSPQSLALEARLVEQLNPAA